MREWIRNRLHTLIEFLRVEDEGRILVLRPIHYGIGISVFAALLILLSLRLHSWLGPLLVSVVTSGIVVLQWGRLSYTRKRSQDSEEYFREKSIYVNQDESEQREEAEDDQGDNNQEDHVQSSESNEEDNQGSQRDNQNNPNNNGDREAGGFDARYHTTEKIRLSGWRYWMTALRCWILTDILVLVGLSTLFFTANFGLSLVGVAAFGLLLTTLDEVPEIHAMVLTCFQRRTACIAYEGYNLRLPFIDKMEEVDLSLQQEDIPEQIALSRDLMPLRGNASVFYRVRNVNLHLETAPPKEMLGQLVPALFRDHIAENKAEDSIKEKEKLADDMRGKLDQESDEFGVEITRFWVTDLRGATDEIDEILQAKGREEYVIRAQELRHKRIRKIAEELIESGIEMSTSEAYELVALGAYQPEKLSKKINKLELGNVNLDKLTEALFSLFSKKLKSDALKDGGV